MSLNGLIGVVGGKRVIVMGDIGFYPNNVFKLNNLRVIIRIKSQH